MPFIYFLLAVMSFFIVYNKIHRDVLHPVAILTSIWFLAAAVASLQWGVYQHQWAVPVHFMIIAAGAACWISGVIAIRHTKQATVIDCPINVIYCLVTRLLFFICFLAVVYVFLKNGINISSISNIEGNDLKTEVGEQLSGISSLESYVINLFPFCAIYSFFELIYGEQGKRHIAYNLFVIIIVIYYCLGVIHSRGTLLYLLLGFLFIYNSKKKLSIKVLVFLLAGVLLLLGIIMTIRVFSGSVVFSGVRHINNPVFSSAYNYIAYSFENFSIIVEKDSRFNIFANVFQSLYKLLGIYNPNQIVSNTVAGVFNSTTWLSSFYDDLGLLGAILYPLLISAILSKWYNKSADNKYYVLMLAVLQKAIFIPFFGNYFLTSLSVIFPYFITGIICYFSYRLKIEYRMPQIKRSIIRFKW